MRVEVHITTTDGPLQVVTTVDGQPVSSPAVPPQKRSYSRKNLRVLPEAEFREKANPAVQRLMDIVERRKEVRIFEIAEDLYTSVQAIGGLIGSTNRWAIEAGFEPIISVDKSCCTWNGFRRPA